MKFPVTDEAGACPHCRTQSVAFGSPSPSCIKYDLKLPRRTQADSHYVRIVYCRTCGMPVIEHVHQVPGSAGKTVVYPVKPTRPEAPKEVCTADLELATDYNEAVACEPHSLQAAVLLLSRCLSHILIDKCDAPKHATLGPQIAHAFKENPLPEDIANEIHPLKAARDQGAHLWFDESGEHLKVDAETAGWWFGVTQMLFEHFYIAPARRENQRNKMATLREKKKAGDKS